MNINTFMLVIVIAISVLLVIATEKSKKDKYKKINDSIQNKLNSKSASLKEVKLAYNYETGKTKFFTNHKDGTSLEYKVFETLYRYEGKVLADLYVNKIDNTSTEIDIVFIHNTGIYVIECKDIRAMEIIGDEQEMKWDCIYNSKYRRKMYNPLKQNLTHIVALKNALRTKCTHDCYTSIVVLNCNNIKSRYNSNFDNYYQSIITPKKLKNHIDLLIRDREQIFSDEQVIDIYKDLHSKYANPSMKIKKSHVSNVKNIAANTKL